MLSAHPFWSLDVPRLDGQLLLTPCPGSQQVPMADALAQLQLAGAGGVLTLMTVEELAREANMSVSAFHHHFKAATATSPLQYIKTLRLHRPSLMTLHEGL